MFNRVRKDRAYTFNDLIMKKGGGTHKMPDGTIMLDSDMPMMKKGGEMMRGMYSLKPVRDALMLSTPLAMKVGGIVDTGLYKDIQNIGFGNKTYIPTI
jgi:hypothetical protein